MEKRNHLGEQILGGNHLGEQKESANGLMEGTAPRTVFRPGSNAIEAFLSDGEGCPVLSCLACPVITELHAGTWDLGQLCRGSGTLMERAV